MKRVKAAAVGAVMLALLLVVSGCGGAAKQQGGGEATKPATSEVSKPSDTSDPYSYDTSKPADASKSDTAATAKPADTSKSDTATTPKPASGTYAIVAGESKASYEVKEVFLVDSLNATAIGTTTAITGDLILENGTFQTSTVVVDVTKLKSDQGIRDNALKSRGLETATYPTAEFTVTGVEGGPISLADGQEASFKLTGRAKIHGVEQPLTWDVTAKLEGDTLRLTGSTIFKMALFQIDPPNIAGRIRVDDTVKLMVDFVAKRKG